MKAARRAAADHRRRPGDAALHHAARVHLAGPVVLARCSRPKIRTTSRSISIRMPGVAFARVLDVARWIRDELDALGAAGVPKTSGADGLHIYMRCRRERLRRRPAFLPDHRDGRRAEASEESRPSSAAWRRVGNASTWTSCRTSSARRSLRPTARGPATYAGVSTPLSWKEVDDGVDREDFTIQTVPARVKTVGDLWAATRTSKPADLTRVTRYAKGKGDKR